MSSRLTRPVTALLTLSALTAHTGLISMRADERVISLMIVTLVPVVFYLTARTWRAPHGYPRRRDRIRHALAALSTSVSTTIGLYLTVPAVGVDAAPITGVVPLLGVLLLPAAILFVITGLWAEASAPHRLDAHVRTAPSIPARRTGPSDRPSDAALLTAA